MNSKTPFRIAAVTLFIASFFALIVCFSAQAQAQTGEYYKNLFAPPSKEELQRVWDETRYEH